MITDGKIKYEKLQNETNRGAGKLSALSSGEIDKYEYLAGKEILHSDQRRIIEQAKFTYAPIGNAFEKQIKQLKIQLKTNQAFRQLKYRSTVNNIW